MGWAYCGTDSEGREIGYAVAATCDEPGCEAKIDRGLDYCCGGMHGGGEHGCGKYFCEEHREYSLVAEERLCSSCIKNYPDPEEED